MKPIDYSQRVSYRPPPKAHSRMQWLGVWLTSLEPTPEELATAAPYYPVFRIEYR